MKCQVCGVRYIDISPSKDDPLCRFCECDELRAQLAASNLVKRLALDMVQRLLKDSSHQWAKENHKWGETSEQAAKLLLQHEVIPA